MRLRALHAAMALLAACACGGCGGEDPTIAVRRELVETRDQLVKSQAQTQQLQKENQQLAEQVQTLQGLGAGKRLDELFLVKKVQVGEYSTGVNAAGKGPDNAVKVYVTTIDQFNSAIKAAGTLKVQLYDLAAPAGGNLLGEMTLGPKELGNRWINGFMSEQYIIECPFKAPPQHDQITVRAVFTDYLTGLSFTDQRVVKVDLLGPVPATKPAK